LIMVKCLSLLDLLLEWFEVVMFEEKLIKWVK